MNERAPFDKSQSKPDFTSIRKYERLPSKEEASMQMNKLWVELDGKEPLSQGRIYSNVLALNRLNMYLVDEGVLDAYDLSFQLKGNYDIGLSRIITHPDFDPNVPNFFATELSRGLQQQERIMQEELRYPIPPDSLKDRKQDTSQ